MLQQEESLVLEHLLSAIALDLPSAGGRIGFSTAAREGVEMGVLRTHQLSVELLQIRSSDKVACLSF